MKLNRTIALFILLIIISCARHETITPPKMTIDPRCPNQPTLNCMPPIEQGSYCDQENITWIEKNCPHLSISS